MLDRNQIADAANKMLFRVLLQVGADVELKALKRRGVSDESEVRDPEKRQALDDAVQIEFNRRVENLHARLARMANCKNLPKGRPPGKRK